MISRKTKIWIIVLASVLVLIVAGAIAAPSIYRHFFEPTASEIPAGQTVNTLNSVEVPETTPQKEPIEPLEEVASDLDIPWEIAFLPDGDFLVTERPGQLIRIGEDKVAIPIEGVRHQGEGGLLGLALHPDFEQNNLLYLYLTTTFGGQVINRVEQYRLSGHELFDRKEILTDIPGSNFHDGGRIAFGPDKKLYVTTGDAGDPDSAQNTATLNGKILRLETDGSFPNDNPFGTAVYSYGHRNPQGLTWDDQGRLWATEHGPSSTAPNSGQDELNLIEAGKNYGWPVVQGDGVGNGFTAPVIHSGISDTWAPSGAAFLAGSIFFAGLRGQALYEAKIVGDAEVKIVAHFREEFGRLRSVSVGPDGLLYLLTSNTDGRGTPQAGDDKIIRIDPAAL